MQRYCIAGLSVDSEAALPGLTARAACAGRPDVTIRYGPVPLVLDHASAAGPTWQIAGDRILLRVPGVARFLLAGGGAVGVERENGAAPEDVAVFLVGTVFGILLHQRGDVVLHASAVRVGDKAVAFCGPSGAGKSTLAAALVARGYALVADEFCRIDADGAPTVQPDGRQLQLWAHAIEHLSLAAASGSAVRGRIEKYYVAPGRTYGDPLPLGAVYALREARPPLRPGIERPNGLDAALVLKRNAYRPRLIGLTGRRADYFRATAGIANGAGIFHLTRPLDFAVMGEAIASLERHWADTGLAGGRAA
jgi:hypothetical protein